MAHNKPQSQSASIAETPVSACWWLYLIRMQSGHLYAGISTDPARRLRQHQGELKGGARNLRGKGPLQLVWQMPMPSRQVAATLEYRLKQLSKADKEALISERKIPNFLADLNPMPNNELHNKTMDLD